ETKTCTITNDDQAGTLIVKKVVINDNGGAKTAGDFKFDVDAGAATAFDKAADNDNNPLTGQNSISVAAGTHSVVENAIPIAGYTTTYSSDFPYTTLFRAETKTCTITNDDQPGTLIVKKLVINDNGGSKTAGNFKFKVD